MANTYGYIPLGVTNGATLCFAQPGRVQSATDIMYVALPQGLSQPSAPTPNNSHKGMVLERTVVQVCTKLQQLAFNFQLMLGLNTPRPPPQTHTHTRSSEVMELGCSAFGTLLWHSGTAPCHTLTAWSSESEFVCCMANAGKEDIPSVVPSRDFMAHTATLWGVLWFRVYVLQPLPQSLSQPSAPIPKIL